MIDFSKFKAAIFDMDGTMINNMLYHQKAWTKFRQKYNHEMDNEEFRQETSGKKNDKIFEFIFGPNLTADQISQFAEEKEDMYRQLYAPDLVEISGLTQFINKLKDTGLKLAIATTAPLKNRELALTKLNLHPFFENILGDEHVSKGKPDPEIYLETAKMLNVEPKDCIVFEDTPVGVEAGKNAGMTVVGVLTTHTHEELEAADYFIHDFTELLSTG